MPELRKDPIIGRWVIIATERAKRPVDYAAEPVVIQAGKFCPFCYGNEDKTPPEIIAYRSNGTPANTPGWSLRVVPNKFPALGIEGELERTGEGLFDRISGIGAHEVIIESPEHQATLAQLPEKRVEDVLWAYRDRIVDLKKDKRFKYVLIFKNHGAAAGASLEHSHSQLIALPIVPQYVREEVEGAKQYYMMKERCIFCDTLRQERESQVRIIAEDSDFITLAPYAPRFPFEAWILPKQHAAAFEEMASPQYEKLARALKSLLARTDKVLTCPAYNFVLHTTPMREDTELYYHWHLEFMPKLTKVAGFEWGTGFYINPTPPEESARELRDVELPVKG
ncbi:MAG: galactose-1-phosphate uridylyltransferase [Candidatus Acidiferrales bacterium]